MSEILSSSPRLDAPKDVNQELEKILTAKIGEDLDLQETDQMKVILSLSEEKKVKLLQVVNAHPESMTEIKDNLPLSSQKLLKILSLYEDKGSEEVGKANEEVGKANEEVGKANEEVGKVNEVVLQNLAQGNDVATRKDEVATNMTDVATKNILRVIDKKEKNEGQNKLNEIIKALIDSLDLTNHPNYKNWMEQSNRVLLSLDPSLADKPEELLMKSQALILEQHKEEFLQKRPDLQNKFHEFSTLAYQDTLIVGALRSQSKEKTIPKMLEVEEKLKKDPSLLKREIEYAQVSILPDAGKLSQVENGVVTIGEAGDGKKQTVIDVNEHKTFLVKNGYKIESSQPYTIDMKQRSEMEDLQKTLQKQKQTLDTFTPALETITSQPKMNKESVTALLQKADTLPPSLQNTLRELSENYGDIAKKESENQNDPLQKEILTAMKEDVKKLEVEVQNQLQRLVTQHQTLGEEMKGNQEKLKELQKGQSEKINTYQSQLKLSEGVHEQTLDFFENIGVTNIPQSDLEKIMRRVNIAPQKYGFSKPFQIENFFQVKAGEDAQKPYREFIQFFNKLTGLTPNEQIKDSLIPKLLDGSDKQYTSADFSAKIRNAFYEGGQIGGPLKMDTFEKNFSNEK